MPPNLIPCEFCNRLYSIYSLQHHVPKCSENPQNFHPIPSTSSKSRRRNTTSGRSKSRDSESRNVLKRSRSVNSSNYSRRPETRTINSEFGYSKTTEKRPCFVCGNYFKFERLDSHSRKCETDWKKARMEMSAFIQTNSPISIQVPSIDGTFDLERVSQLATRSAEKAQSAKCKKCNSIMSFGEAITHRCSKREPTIEFFF